LIISSNFEAEDLRFRRLVSSANELLNSNASMDPEYYMERSGLKLEDCVLEAYEECAEGTEFEGTIRKADVQKFPDIIVNGYYGVEVKSTKADSWKSTGSSILESSRIESVKRIYMVFGKLHYPVEFKSRPYEECLSEIAVTHYPRYRIDMSLAEGETIFDKMGHSYAEISHSANPVALVRDYYRKQLGEGESLWWDGTDEPDTFRGLPPVIRLWRNLSKEDKNAFLIEGLARFPEILYGGRSSFDRYSVWLFRDNGVANPSVRDTFSAGGTVTIIVDGRSYHSVPHVVGNLAVYAGLVKSRIDEVYRDEFGGRGLSGWLSVVQHSGWKYAGLVRDLMCSDNQIEVTK
jgi:hypothetical protein